MGAGERVMSHAYRLRALATVRNATDARRRTRRRAVFAAAAAAALALNGVASRDTRAATVTWDGGTTGTGTTWLTNTNWNGDVIPTATDVAQFDVMGIGGTGTGGTVVSINSNTNA